MLLDRGLLRTERGELELLSTALPRPESVQAIVAARLDALPPEEKPLVQDGRGRGQVVLAGRALRDREEPRWSVEHQLHELERKQLIRRERDSVVLSEPQFSFSHVIVSDVAYEQIPRPVRAEQHRRAARWLEAAVARARARTVPRCSPTTI